MLPVSPAVLAGVAATFALQPLCLQREPLQTLVFLQACPEPQLLSRVLVGCLATLLRPVLVLQVVLRLLARCKPCTCPG